MIFPYLSCENTWPRGPSQGQGKRTWAPWAGPGPSPGLGGAVPGPGALGPCAPKGLGSALEPPVAMYFHKKGIGIT